MSLVYALLGISFLVLVHETGHFAAARLCRIPVLSFAVGFGPALFKYKHRGTLYRINLLPLGGYVTTPVEELKGAPVRTRLLFFSAGIVMNVLLAIVFITILFSYTGVPQPVGDHLTYTKTVPLYQGVWLAFVSCFQMTGEIVNGFLHLLSGMVPVEQLGGPVQIVQTTGQASEMGLPFFLFYLSALSLNLAVLNLLPIPSLDGSHLLFTVIEALRRGKRIPLERESLIHFVGLMAMFALMIFVTVQDLHWLD